MVPLRLSVGPSFVLGFSQLDLSRGLTGSRQHRSNVVRHCGPLWEVALQRTTRALIFVVPVKMVRSLFTLHDCVFFGVGTYGGHAEYGLLFVEGAAFSRVQEAERLVGWKLRPDAQLVQAKAINEPHTTTVHGRQATQGLPEVASCSLYSDAKVPQLRNHKAKHHVEVTHQNPDLVPHQHIRQVGPEMFVCVIKAAAGFSLRCKPVHVDGGNIVL